jgi:hypothetical protein
VQRGRRVAGAVAMGMRVSRLLPPSLWRMLCCMRRRLHTEHTWWLRGGRWQPHRRATQHRHPDRETQRQLRKPTLFILFKLGDRQRQLHGLEQQRGRRVGRQSRAGREGRRRQRWAGRQGPPHEWEQRRRRVAEHPRHPDRGGYRRRRKARCQSQAEREGQRLPRRAGRHGHRHKGEQRRRRVAARLGGMGQPRPRRAGRLRP